MTSWFLLPASTMFARASACAACKRPVTLRLLKNPRNHYLHVSPALKLPRRRDFFSSNTFLAQRQNDETTEHPEPEKQRRRGGRAPAAPTSLRRVAVEAQRSRDGFLSKAQLKEQGIHQTKVRQVGVMGHGRD